MLSFKASAINDISARNIYGTASGASLGVRSTALTPYSIDDMQSGSANVAPGSTSSTAEGAAAMASAGGVLGRPISWWLVLVVFLVGIIVLAKKTGNATEFSNIKGSVYNVLFITLSAVVGILFLKVLANKVSSGSAFTSVINAV
jgi:hypothetical protein